MILLPAFATTYFMFKHSYGSMVTLGFPGGSEVKNPPASAGATGDRGSIPASGRSPVFLPEDSHGQRSPAGCSPRGRKESDMTENLAHTWLLYSVVLLYFNAVGDGGCVDMSFLLL